MTNPAVKTRVVRTIPFHGREIKVRQLVDAQLILLSREAKVLQRDDMDTQRKLDGVDRMFRILESAIVEDADRTFVDDLIIAGELDLAELVSMVQMFTMTDAEEAPAPKVRRGRPSLKA